MTKKREGKIEVERNDGLRVPWGGQKSDKLNDERWAGTAGQSDMGSDPRIQLVEECMHAKLLQLCLTLCDPMDCSWPGSSVHGILQARKLEWVAISHSMEPSWPRDRTHVSGISCTGKWILYHYRHPHGPPLRGLMVVCAATSRGVKNTSYSNPNCKALEGLTEDLDASDWAIWGGLLKG